ncbi:MAG: hypothetical protein M3680_24315 [Myxococcota bacterium]|nr:hypothetical protein [Myxococcota bacterium]
MAARGELLRGLVIGVVIGAVVTVGIYQLRGDAPTAATARCAPGTAGAAGPR